MSRFFDQVERELVRAARRSAQARAQVPRRPRALAIALAALLALTVAGTAAGAAYLALRSSSIAPFADRDIAPEQRVAPGTSRVVELRERDPRPGAPPWALRLARSEAGLLCTTVGQVREGEFGLVGLDGRFRGLPEANADACAEDGVMVGNRVFAARRLSAVRTVVNGVVSGLESVTVASRGGPARAVAHTPEGAFLAVLRGYPEDAQPVVTIERGDGSRRRYAFADDGSVVPDPLGGRAWRLEAFMFGRSRQRGEPPQEPPRVQPACVQFMPARAVPGRRNVLSPPVCGLQAGRPGVRIRELYFRTERLSGDRPAGADVLLRGDWNGHPPRTAVWGSARGSRRIVVTAPGHRRVTAPKPNAAFLVILPPSTRPSDVAVEIDGRRYGPTFGTIDPRRAR